MIYLSFLIVRYGDKQCENVAIIYAAVFLNNSPTLLAHENGRIEALGHMLCEHYFRILKFQNSDICLISS